MIPGCSFFAGFVAVLFVPGLPNGDLAMLTVVRQTFPPWFVGVIGGGGALTAMVPAAIFILTAATLFAKNLYRPLFAPAMSDEQVAGRSGVRRNDCWSGHGCVFDVESS